MTKPKVLAFLLWKESRGNDPDSSDSWKLYDRWLHLNQRMGEAWFEASRSIQSFEVRISELCILYNNG